VGEEVGVPNSDNWRKSLALCLLFDEKKTADPQQKKRLFFSLIYTKPSPKDPFVLMPNGWRPPAVYTELETPVYCTSVKSQLSSLPSLT
jgi:hypothetical protein